MLKAEQSNIILQSLTIDSDRIKADQNTKKYWIEKISMLLILSMKSAAHYDNFNVILDGTVDGSIGSLMGKYAEQRPSVNVYGIYATCPTDVAIIE